MVAARSHDAAGAAVAAVAAPVPSRAEARAGEGSGLRAVHALLFARASDPARVALGGREGVADILAGPGRPGEQALALVREERHVGDGRPNAETRVDIIQARGVHG